MSNGEIRLRDGTAAGDPRLDRLVEFDGRSRDYPVRSAGEEVAPGSYTWRLTTDYIIDQGREGSCVGYAVVNELQARPAEVRPGGLGEASSLARQIYHQAQRIDPWPGEDYSGTSVLAGMKIGKKLGWFEGYRWAFGLADLVHGLGRNGPAILGVNWYDTMYTPRDGYVSPRGGTLVGGHAILARRIRVKWLPRAQSKTWADVDLNRSFVTLRNSWGPGWGNRGDARITLSDLDWLLDRRGEAVFALHRTAAV